ncbi:MAG: glutaredoxin 3 [Thalassotalea sp.]|nr:glutaredoxin 3 [Thalassotalea sp.]
MAKVEVYSKGYCVFCMATKGTLKKLNVEFQEFDITTDSKKTKEMIERSQRRTVPQIFVNDQHIGGNDDLQVALGNGKLLALLNS